MIKNNSSNISIGWASRDITPDRPVNLQGQFPMRISKGIKDPLTVTALALAAGGSSKEAVIFVSCDVSRVPAQLFDKCRAAVRAKASEIDADQIIINATHTHTAPQLAEHWYPPVPAGVMTPEEYAELFIKQMAEAAAEAWANRQAGGISFGLGTAVVGHNRRATYFNELNSSRIGLVMDGRTKQCGDTNDRQFSHIEGYEDHYVNLLYTWDENKQLTGIVVNLACPSQETEGDYYVSADFWHEVRTEIRKRQGQRLFILPQCSAAGDQSPHRLWYKEAEQRMLKLRGLNMREEIGRRVANAVDDVLPPARQAVQTEIRLARMVKKIELPRRMITAQEADAVRSDLAKLEEATPEEKNDKTYGARIWRCRRALERYEMQKENPKIPMELHGVRLGDAAFITSRFEYFLDFGVRIKARSPAAQTFIIQLTADKYGSGTYLPTERAMAGKGYSGGVYDNEVGPEGGQVIVEETVKVLKELWPARNAGA